MCQQIIQFCNNSAKLLLFVGAALTFLLAVTIGYNGCTTQALYNLIDDNVAQQRSLGYHLQLACAGYLAFLALLSCYTAQYDHKYSIRALAVLSSVTCLLALAAVFMVPTSQEVSEPFRQTLVTAAANYDIKEDFPKENTTRLTASVSNVDITALNTTNRNRRWSENDQSTSKITPPRELNKHDSTCLWDRLQALGCCGLDQANTTWTGDREYPKSCCARELVKKTPDGYKCPQVDGAHQQGCMRLIGGTSSTLSIVLVLIAAVSLYLTVVSGISTYRTIHYSEASQSAYT